MSASPKKRASTSAAKPKKTASHPPYQQMVKMAVQNLKEAKGSSRAAILKYIMAHYKVGDNPKMVNARLRAALKRGVTSGALKQTKGTGASGSFRLGESKAKKAVAKPKKTTTPKKTATKKTTTAKKSPAKPKTKKSPKAKKPATKKSPKKPKASPKKPKATPKKAAKPKTKKSPKKTAAK